MADKEKETRLYLVRHGETVWNAENRIQGIKDSPLTEKGIKHAQLLAESLAGMAGPVEKIFSSPLGRAFGTAEIIGRQLSLPVTVDERLVERNMGIFEGLSWESVREKYPGEFSKTVSNDNGYQIPEGESKSEYLEKVSSFLDFAAHERKGEIILAVTHRGFINFALRIILSVPLDARMGILVKNTSLFSLVFHKGRWMLERFGDLQCFS